MKGGNLQFISPLPSSPLSSEFLIALSHHQRYRCTVGTVRDTAFAEVPLTVIVNAPQITKHSSDTRVFSGTSIDLQCISNGIPEPEVRWSLNETMTEVVGEDFAINAAIAGVDSGRYVCTATNSIGRTEKSIEVSVVTLPNLESEYRVKKGKRLALPCLPSSSAVQTIWKKGDEEIEGDHEGRLVLHGMMEEREGEYSCQVTIVESGESRVLHTSVRIIPDIVTTESQRVEVREGEEFQLHCDVMPGINAKRMWMKDGAMVAFESEGRLHFEDNGGTVAVRRAKLGDQGVWACVATVAWGKDEIEYRVDVRQRASGLACSRRETPEIASIQSLSNTSVILDWQVVIIIIMSSSLSMMIRHFS